MFVPINELPPTTELVEFRFEGQPYCARRGIPVAAALLALGASSVRTSVVSGEPRGPLCLMGNCFDCLVEIDGQANIQSCQVPLEAGMEIRRQRGRREVEEQR